MKKVSIIVPVYNVEKYLEKCLKSLVNQTLQDIEILVINDGSEDNSQYIIDDFYNKHPEKIVPLIKENGGLSDARNFGLDRAIGEYVGFVDSDDWVEAGMYEDMYFLAKKYDAEMVICNLQKVNDKGEVIQKLTQIPNMPREILLKDNFSVFSDISYFACNKLFRRELFDECRFRKGMHFEDIQLIPQLLLKCDTIAHTQEYYYQYYERVDSITKTHTEKGLDIFRAIEDVENAFIKSKYSNFIEELKGFCILEGFYTFLAYLAYVKEDAIYNSMSNSLKEFIKKRGISLIEILRYRRFGKNYLLSLPMKKKLYYLLYILGQEWFLRKILK